MSARALVSIGLLLLSCVDDGGSLSAEAGVADAGTEAQSADVPPQSGSCRDDDLGNTVQALSHALWGPGSSRSSQGVPLVADFNGDGTIDIGVQQSAGLGHGLLRIFTSGIPFNNRYTYLRFPLSSVASGVASARLRLHGSRGLVTPATLAAFAVSSTSWGETTITWNNKPALGAKQADSVLITPTDRYYEWDVTAFVKAQKAAGATAVSLAIKMDQNVNNAPDIFSSREAPVNRPELVVTLVPPPPPQ